MQGLREREAVHVRHGDVHDHDARGQAANLVQDRPAVRRFTDDFHVRLATDDGFQTFEDGEMIIDEVNLQFLHRLLQLFDRGTAYNTLPLALTKIVPAVHTCPG